MPYPVQEQTMFRIIRTSSFVVFPLALSLVFSLSGRAQPPEAAKKQEKVYMHEVNGIFEVKIVPEETGDPKMGMMKIDKKYQGDLEGTGKGRMLTGLTDVKTSAAYVAIERVEGKLKGLAGSFLVHHTGVRTKESQSLVVRIVPDSGTGDLAGIEGEMQIMIKEGQHSYRLQYNLEKK
jgi:hypothetical protein